MTEKELAAELKGNFTKGFAGRYGRLIAEHDLFGDALSLGLDSDPSVAFHASYALERAFFIAPEAFERHIGHFVRNYLAIVNPSACRHYSKMMAWLLDRKRIELTDSRPADRPVGASGRKSVVDGDTRHPVGRIAVGRRAALRYDLLANARRRSGAAEPGSENLPPHPCATADCAAVIAVYSRFLYL